MNILIADDEPLARKRISRLLADQSDCEVVGEAKDGATALAIIQTLNPDLVFLDIQMPDMTGLEVVEALDVDRAPVIVFVTAYDAYALMAFEHFALDYLLKPFEDERFWQTLERARRAAADRELHQFRHALNSWVQMEHQSNPPLQTKQPAIKRFAVQSRGGVTFVPIAEVDWLEAEGVYVRLHAGKRTQLIRDSLRHLEEVLPQDQFARIHRSTMVNISRVQALIPLSRGDGEVALVDGTRLRLSRAYRKSFQRVLGY